MSRLVNFTVLCGELGKRLPLLPYADGKVASLIAAQPHQAPFGGSFASPRANLGRSRQPRIIEFAHCVADSSLAATQLIGGFAHPESDHAVVAAVVAVDQFKQEASGVWAETVIGRASLDVGVELKEFPLGPSTDAAHPSLLGAVFSHRPSFRRYRADALVVH